MKRLVIIPPPSPPPERPAGQDRRVEQRRLAIGRRTGQQRRDSIFPVELEREARALPERRRVRDRRRVPDRRLGVNLPAELFRTTDS